MYAIPIAQMHRLLFSFFLLNAALCQKNKKLPAAPRKSTTHCLLEVEDYRSMVPPRPLRSSACLTNSRVAPDGASVTYWPPTRRARLILNRHVVDIHRVFVRQSVIAVFAPRPARVINLLLGLRSCGHRLRDSPETVQCALLRHGLLCRKLLLLLLLLM